MKKLLYLGVFACVAAVGVSTWRWLELRDQPLVISTVPGPPQPRVPANEAGIDPVVLAAAVDYAGARNSSALVVGRGGHIVFERYWGQATADTPVDVPGFTPVLAALAVGAAMNDRVLLNLDRPAANYLGDAAPARAAASVRDLMALHGEGADPAADANLVARVLEKAAGKRYDTLIAQWLWKPLGAGELGLSRAGSGEDLVVRADCCLRARIGDLMRLGELLANDGVFEGNQLAPPRYVTLMLKPAGKDEPRGFFVRVDGQFATRDVAWLDSAGYQRLWVVPSLKLVILRTGGEPRDWDESMIPDTIIRGTSGWTPAKGEGIDPKMFAPH